MWIARYSGVSLIYSICNVLKKAHKHTAIFVPVLPRFPVGVCSLVCYLSKSGCFTIKILQTYQHIAIVLVLYVHVAHNVTLKYGYLANFIEKCSISYSSRPTQPKLMCTVCITIVSPLL